MHRFKLFTTWTDRSFVPIPCFRVIRNPASSPNVGTLELCPLSHLESTITFAGKTEYKTVYNPCAAGTPSPIRSRGARLPRCCANEAFLSDAKESC